MDLFSDQFLTAPNHVWLFIQAVLGLFHGVLFLQSGADKVTDFGGNVGWLKGHFEGTIFGNFVPALVGVITVMEIVTGIAAFIGVGCLFMGLRWPAVIAAGLSLITLLQLFAGQRIAKDYPGAAVLIPYAIFSVIWLVSLTQGVS